MLNQAGRYLVSFMLVHNDYAQRRHGGPRPTLTALQATVGSSPRQTAAFVAALKAARLVGVETDPDDGRVKHLRATPALVTEIGRSARLFVAAMDFLAARCPGRARALEHPDRLGDLICRSAAHVLRHGMLTDPFPRILRLTGRDCGYPLLTAIVGAHFAATVSDAPAPLPLSLRGLADRLGVSRAHVGNLLREADEAGWFRTGDRRLTHLDPSLLEEFELWAACQMIFYDDLAGEICAEASVEAGVEAAGPPERAGLACVPAVPEIPTGSAAP
ncbi:helix-turn-helix domain-containing protein [Methylobacterium sp. A49B]